MNTPNKPINIFNESDADLIKGIEVARQNGVTLSIYKTEILKGLVIAVPMTEDKWTSDYTTYLHHIAYHNYPVLADWGSFFYHRLWSSFKYENYGKE